MEPALSFHGATSLDGASARRIARGLLDPLHLFALPVILLLLVARQRGLTTHLATWQIVGFYLVVHLAAVIFQLCFPPGTSRARPFPFLVTLIGTSGAFMYALGWGSSLSVSLITGAAIAIESDGSRFGRPAMGIVLVTILAGEFAVEVGVVGSILPTATGHFVALIGASVAISLITLLTRGQRELERAEAGKQATEERFRALIQHASDAILVVDEHGTVTYASPAASQLLRCEPTQLERFDLTWFEANDIDAIVELWQKLGEQPGSVAAIEVPLRRPDGSSNWFEIHFTNLTQNPAVGGVVCNLRDVNERRVAQQGLLHGLQHDPVTLLPNRRYFLEHLEQACRNSASDQVIALLFIDVDHFKRINDELRHAAGDEFVALLTGLGNANAALVVADRMAAELLCAPPTVGGRDLKVSVSIGVATSRGGSRSGVLTVDCQNVSP
jgi:PAS domain S-box-containing protein